MKCRTKLVLLFTSLSLSFSSPLFAAEKIRVYAASSLTNALNSLIADYSKQHDASIVAIYAGSSSLARQIEQGAPADIYISANTLWVDYLIKQGVVGKQNVNNFAHNQLVVIAPKTSHVSLNAHDAASWLNALNDQRLAIGQTNAVPAGIYAKQALEYLGVWEAVHTSLAPTNNVRTTLALVERGEAPLGIVYLSDAQVSDKVKIIYRFAPTSHQAIDYPIVTLSQTKSVKQFSAYLQSEVAKNTVRQYGFE